MQEGQEGINCGLSVTAVLCHLLHKSHVTHMYFELDQRLQDMNLIILLYMITGGKPCIFSDLLLVWTGKYLISSAAVEFETCDLPHGISL